MNEIRNCLLEKNGIKKKENELFLSDWEELSELRILSEEFIREFKDKVDWYLVSIYQVLSEGFIREFKDDVVWSYISQYQTLSEDFIREFQNELEWEEITEEQNLSENFIREFQQKVDWGWISEKYKVTDAFLIEFKDKIDWNVYFDFNVPSFVIYKKFIYKTHFIDLDGLNTSLLDDNQKRDIEKILKLKYVFIKK